MNTFRKPYYNIDEKVRYYNEDGGYDEVRVLECQLISRSYVYKIEWEDGSSISVLESSLKKSHIKCDDDSLFRGR